jgi:hypothetical protein
MVQDFNARHAEDLLLPVHDTRRQGKGEEGCRRGISMNPLFYRTRLQHDFRSFFFVTGFMSLPACDSFMTVIEFRAFINAAGAITSSDYLSTPCRGFYRSDATLFPLPYSVCSMSEEQGPVRGGAGECSRRWGRGKTMIRTGTRTWFIGRRSREERHVEREARGERVPASH